MKYMKYIRNEKGMAMPLTLIVMVVIALLGIALWQYSMSELSTSVRSEKRARAHYIARAGAEAVALDFMRNPNKIEDLNLSVGDPIITDEIDYLAVNNESVDELVGQVSVEISRTDNYIIRITGFGTVDGIEQQVAIILEALEPFDGVMYSAKSISFGNSIIDNNRIKGDVVSGGLVYKQNSLLDEHPNAAAGDEIRTEQILTFPDPVFPASPASYTTNALIVSNPVTITASSRPNPDGEETIGSSTGYHKIDIQQSGKLVIDASSGPVVVQTNEFTSHNQGELELITAKGKDLIIVVENGMKYRNVRVKGDGLAKIYVKSGEIDAANTHANMIDEGAYLVLYLGAGVKMSIQTGNVFEGLIYGPKAIVELQANNNFYGSIIADQISGNNSGNIGSYETLEKYGWDILDDIFGRYRMIQYIP